MEEEQKKNKRKTTFKTETHTRNKTQIHNKFARTLTNIISLSREDIPTGATAPHQKKTVRHLWMIICRLACTFYIQPPRHEQTFYYLYKNIFDGSNDIKIFHFYFFLAHILSRTHSQRLATAVTARIKKEKPAVVGESETNRNRGIKKIGAYAHTQQCKHRLRKKHKQTYYCAATWQYKRKILLEAFARYYGAKWILCGVLFLLLFVNSPYCEILKSYEIIYLTQSINSVRYFRWKVNKNDRNRFRASQQLMEVHPWSNGCDR